MGAGVDRLRPEKPHDVAVVERLEQRNLRLKGGEELVLGRVGILVRWEDVGLLHRHRRLAHHAHVHPPKLALAQLLALDHFAGHLWCHGANQLRKKGV